MQKETGVLRFQRKSGSLFFLSVCFFFYQRHGNYDHDKHEQDGCSRGKNRHRIVASHVIHCAEDGDERCRDQQTEH